MNIELEKAIENVKEFNKQKFRDCGVLNQSIDIVLEELNNRIPRKDIEDLKEKIHWELDKNGITRAYQIVIDGYFNKLLNKE